MEAIISALTPSDWALLREHVQSVKIVLRRKYGTANLDTTSADLGALQRLLDDQLPDPSETEWLEALGTVFGNVLEKQLNFEWVAAEEGGVRRPALRLKVLRSFLIYPLTLISSQVETNTPINLAGMFKMIKNDVSRSRMV